MNGYQELKEIHRLAHEAVVELDKGEFPERRLIASIREIAGRFPKFGSDNEYIGYARWWHRTDNQQPYLSICDSSDDGAFPIYRHPAVGEYSRLKEAVNTIPAALMLAGGPPFTLTFTEACLKEILESQQ